MGGGDFQAGELCHYGQDRQFCLGSFGKQDVLIPAPGGPSNFISECHLSRRACCLSMHQRNPGPAKRQEAPHAIFEGCDLMARRVGELGCPDIYFPLPLWNDHSYMDPVCTRRSSSRTWDPFWDLSLSCPFWERNLDSSYSLFTVALCPSRRPHPTTLSCDIFRWHFRWLGCLLHLLGNFSDHGGKKTSSATQQNIDFLHFQLLENQRTDSQSPNSFFENMGVSLNGGTPKMIIFSRKNHGCWVPPF